jgi:anti-sigma regulatory factor (Ser/Thr protein kinase)
MGESMATTETTVEPAREPDRGLQHMALLYAGDREFLSGTLPFVRDGVAAGEPVLVVVDAERSEQLRVELDGSSDRIFFVTAVRSRRDRPERFIPGWRTYLQRTSGDRFDARVWAIGEPRGLPSSTGELIDAQRHESLLDAAFAGDRPFSLLCPYDTDSVDASEIKHARGSHHATLRRGTRRRNPGAVSAGYNGHRLPEPDSVLEEYRFTADRLAKVRALVESQTARLGLGGGRTYDYVLAVDEVAANSVIHGGGAGTLRIWRTGDCLTTEIRDRGFLDVASATPEQRPAADLPHGRGLWLIHQLCDLVQTRSTPAEGTTTRLHISRT